MGNFNSNSGVNKTVLTFSDVEVTNGNITFPSGTLSGTSDCFNISIVVDSILEGDETVTLELASDDAIIGSNISLTIQDDDDIQGISI